MLQKKGKKEKQFLHWVLGNIKLLRNVQGVFYPSITLINGEVSFLSEKVVKLVSFSFT